MCRHGGAARADRICEHGGGDGAAAALRVAREEQEVRVHGTSRGHETTGRLSHFPTVFF